MICGHLNERFRSCVLLLGNYMCADELHCLSLFCFGILRLRIEKCLYMTLSCLFNVWYPQTNYDSRECVVPIS